LTCRPQRRFKGTSQTRHRDGGRANAGNCFARTPLAHRREGTTIAKKRADSTTIPHSYGGHSLWTIGVEPRSSSRPPRALMMRLRPSFGQSTTAHRASSLFRSLPWAPGPPRRLICAPMPLKLFDAACSSRVQSVPGSALWPVAPVGGRRASQACAHGVAGRALWPVCAASAEGRS
jgi:hypothetical protein